jgi:hypothetical protein
MHNAGVLKGQGHKIITGLKRHVLTGQGLPGIYILENTPPPHQGGGGKISANVVWGKKYEKVKRKKGENVKEKGRKGKEKGRKGKGNEKRGSKRVK